MVSNLKKYKLEILLFFIFSLFFYGVFLIPHFAPDTYNIYYGGNFSPSRAAYANGRPITGILLSIFDFSPSNIKFNNLTINMLSISFLAISALIMYIYISILIKSESSFLKISVFSLCLIAFHNPYFCDVFSFIEVYAYSLALIIAVISSGLPLLNIKNSWKIFLGILGTTLIILTYQAMINYVLIISCFFVTIKFIITPNKQQRFSKFVMECLIYCVIYIMAGILGFIYLKTQPIIVNRAQIQIDKIPTNIRLLFQNAEDLLINNQSLYPRYIWLIFCICILFMILISCIKTQKYKTFFAIFLSVSGSFSIVWIFSIIMPEFWPAQRTITSLMLVPAIIVGYFAILIDANRNFSLKLVCLFASIVFVAIGNIMTIIKGTDLIATNYLDQYTAKYYMNHILEYEQITGKTITSVGFVYDQYTHWSYPGITASYDLNKKALTMPYSQTSLLTHVSGRQFKQLNITFKEIEDKFSTTNWDALSPAQIVFVEEVVYIVIF